jgi:putative SOS response-associated peptidase YedK
VPGRFAQFFPWQTLWDLYGLNGPIPSEPLRSRYNLAPTQQAVVLRLDPQTGEREVVSLRWGLIPRWTKPDAPKNLELINARSDGVAVKPAFREAFKLRRCVVPASGYYEWKTVEKKKQPFFVRRDDGVPLSFAGLWEHWAPEGREPLTTFAIITTDPNEYIAPLHHRMGVLLKSEDVATWLDPDAPQAMLHTLMASRPWPGVRYQAANPVVNNVKNDGPTCIEP